MGEQICSSISRYFLGSMIKCCIALMPPEENMPWLFYLHVTVLCRFGQEKGKANTQKYTPSKFSAAGLFRIFGSRRKFPDPADWLPNFYLCRELTLCILSPFGTDVHG